MKQFYYRILSGFLPVILIASIFVNVNAQEMQVQKYCYPEGQAVYEPVKVSIENLVSKERKANNPKILVENFTTIDSMANAYSYFFLMENKPYVYDRTTGNLITVKRGYYSQYNPEHSGYSGTDWNYNIFIRISKDGGFTWEEPVLLYDKDAIGYFEARYPTCYGFKMNGTQYVASNFPVIDYNPATESEWKGYVSILWNESNPTLIPMNANIEPIFGGVSYNWSVDSKILAGEKPGSPGEFYFLAASEIYPKDNTDFANSSHFAMRRIENDIEGNFVESIPDAWNANKFTLINQAGFRINQFIDLKLSDDGIMYLAAYGNFINDDANYPNYNRVGVSKSIDYGLTWENYDVVPHSVRANYCSELGFPNDTLIIGYSTKGFIPFDNGDWTFIVHGVFKTNTSTYHDSQIIEIYKSGGNWNMRKVADITGSWMVYRDYLTTTNESSNPSDIELQVAASANGSDLIVKWVDLIDYDPQARTYRTNDIYLASKSKNGNTWGDKINVTNSDEIDRATLLPDYIPDVSDIPILKLESISGAQDSTVIPQYLKVGFFTAVVSVDENQYYNSQLSLEVLPNPVSDFARIKVYYEGKPVQAEVSVYDLLGNKVESIELPNLSYGTSFHDLKTSGMNSGVYMCTISVGDKKITKMMNVIK